MAPPAQDLVTLEEVRAAGLTVPMASDAQVSAAITTASFLVERLCGQPFRSVSRPVADPLVFDGTGRRELWLDVPIISCSECGLVDSSGSKTAFSSSTWRAYMRTGPGADDRANPKVVRTNTEGTWPEGDQNVYVAGAFGYVEPDPTSGVARAPLDIRRAVLLLVVNDFAWLLTDQDRQDDRLRRYLTSESTEGHSYSLSSASQSSGSTGLLEVDTILHRYRRPRHVVVRRPAERPRTRI